MNTKILSAKDLLTNYCQGVPFSSWFGKILRRVRPLGRYHYEVPMTLDHLGTCEVEGMHVPVCWHYVTDASAAARMQDLAGFCRKHGIVCRFRRPAELNRRVLICEFYQEAQE